MHPYKNVPATRFWSQSVSRAFQPEDLLPRGVRLVSEGDKVMTAGSCFASNLVPYLESAGFTYLRTERVNPSFQLTPPENLGYGNFSAAYGNIYTARQLLQLLRRCRGRFKPVEDRWITETGVIDPFRPGLKYHAWTEKEFDLLTAQHLKACLRAFAEADVFILTFGLTEAWVSRSDGAVFPACPGTVAGTFNPDLHQFVNFSVSEVVDDMSSFISELRELNPNVRIILTVSPVPLVATATDQHVLCASIYSKSVLRVAAEQAAAAHPNVIYFPSYEIVTGPQAPYEFFEDDRRNVSKNAVAEVMAAFLSRCDTVAVREGETSRAEPAAEPLSLLSTALADAECEEAMLDSHRRR